MTAPITIETNLGEALAQINQKLGDVQKELTDFRIETKVAVEKLTGEITTLDKKLTGQITTLDERLTGQITTLDERLTGEIKTSDERLTGQITTLDERLTGAIKTLDAKVDGIGKRLDNQEFINRSVVVGLILAITAGIIKLFFPGLSSNP